MNKKTYRIDYNGLWEMEVEIDHDFPEVEKNIKEMVNFWSNVEWDLEDCNGDYIKLFLKNISQIAVNMSQHYKGSFVGENFDENEGYCKLDGSQGIKILTCDRWSFDKCDFDVFKK